MSMISKRVVAAVILLLLITTIIFSDNSVSGAIKSWDEHYSKIESDISGGWGKHVLLKNTSDVTVASFTYNEGKTVDIYYPPDMDFSMPSPVLILIGLSDIAIKREYGIPYRYTGQAVGWAQVAAEAGLVVLVHETGGSPNKDLVALVDWIRSRGDEYGIDGNKIGLWASSDACDIAVKAIRPDKNGFPRPSASFAVFYYGNLTAYSMMDTDVPILIATAESDGWTDMARIEKFVGKMQNLGSHVTHIHHSSGGHTFELGEYKEETVALIQQTITFMLKHSKY